MPNGCKEGRNGIMIINARCDKVEAESRSQNVCVCERERECVCVCVTDVVQLNLCGMKGVGCE